jgi:hypothetical protein
MLNEIEGRKSMKIKGMLKVALVAGMFPLITHCFSAAAADWKQQVRSGKIVSEGTITEGYDKEEITNILHRKGYTDLEVIGGDVAWVAPSNKPIRTIYFKANCLSNKGGTAIVEGWLDYLNPNKYQITKVYRTPK